MSWIDKIQNKLIITCGDGKKYNPSWLNASYQVDYNVSEFEFPNLEGTLVDRKKRLGRKYGLELYFTGDDHLDITKQFELSANNPKPWTLEHPFYDILIVQPTSLFIDNSDYNVSKITGVVIETIVNNNPKITIEPASQIKIDNENLNTSFEQAFSEKFKPADFTTMKTKNAANYKLNVPQIKLPEEAENYLNAFSNANSAINTGAAYPTAAIRAVITLIQAPALFSISVKNRVDLLVGQFQNFRTNLSSNTTVSSKQLYQNQAGSTISALCLAMATPLSGDYANAPVVLSFIEILLANFNAYKTDLDTLQSDNGGNPNNFIPDATALIELNNLVNLTLDSLFTIALSAQKERSIIVEEDTNLINLTHRFYGLDANDANIEKLIANNNWGLNQLLEINKGTKIVYYK